MKQHVHAGAVARQDHYTNGSVLLSFDVFMNAPVAGESGTLTASVQDGSGPWTVSKNVSLPVTGENNATVQVCCASTLRELLPAGLHCDSLNDTILLPLDCSASIFPI